jgi:hypothetical protein
MLAGVPISKRWDPQRSAKSNSHAKNSVPPVTQVDEADLVEKCKLLIKILHKRLYAMQQAESGDNNSNSQSSLETTAQQSKHSAPQPFSFDAKQVAFPTNSVYSRHKPWRKIESPKFSPTNVSYWKKPAKVEELCKMGIQMGKTKVFLRHKVFEALERMRSDEQASAATKLNAMFRRYIARTAFLYVRDVVPAKLRDYRKQEEEFQDEFKETKEQEYEDRRWHFFRDSGKWKSVPAPLSLIDLCQIRGKTSIHNPTPRHEWGKQAPLDASNFKWVLVDGIWQRNWNVAE